MTPFEQGYQDGAKMPNDEALAPADFLAHQEQVYQECVAELPQLRPEYAATQAEYLKGWIAGVRASIK